VSHKGKALQKQYTRLLVPERGLEPRSTASQYQRSDYLQDYLYLKQKSPPAKLPGLFL